MNEHNDSKLLALSELIASCTQAAESGSFAASLVSGLRKLTAIDDATVLYYARGDLPTVVYEEVPGAQQVNTLERFVAGAFLLDPFYQAATENNRFGLFRLQDLAPARFRDSEYYRKWYRNCGFNDECGYLIQLGNDAFVNVALGRLEGRRFTPAQVKILRSIYLSIETVCRLHWGRAGGSGEGLRRQLHLALDDFGSSVLTDRETQVINMILHGHSSKSVAERLGISTETVKLHRKHAYAKLEISSQAELFYLFLDSLMSSTNYQGGDTLISYLQRPPHTT